ncbi:type 1 glutamine amidotransferase [Ornithinimicrobium cerasi]|uniref:type 1 glutamine amidotransferase n=1 Tax=Ornithinimicrobium cerasi TaxID=2248773 RepID=UPI000EFE7BEF|nr:type 1 glutamine amidotransferase [Ornithinimicrobium cerasi]
MAEVPRVLVVQHEDDCPVGMIEPWLLRAGLDVDVLPAHGGRALPAALGDHLGLIVLGGKMGAQDDAEHRWLLPTRALIGATVAADLPFLGVCLGHQLGAVALGGEVRRNERGPLHRLVPFAATPDGRTDPLTGVLGADSTVLHWNNDVVTVLPTGATEIARAPDGTVQAARFGRRAWGVQFHPEADASIVARWSAGPDPATDRATLEELERRRAELHRSWEALLRRFARLVLSG